MWGMHRGTPSAAVGELSLSLACSRGNFANPRDTKRNVVTSGPLSCGGRSRFTLGAGAGTENHDCRSQREETLRTG